MSPRWRSASGSVRKRPKHQSAKAPREHQVFCPSRIQPSPPGARRARLRSAARSLPASGSDQPWHQISSPEAMGGRNRAFCWAGAELQQGGGQEEDPVLAHPGRRPGPVVLLLEDEPLEDPDAPARRTPRASETTDQRSADMRPLPGAVLLEALGRVQRGQATRRPGTLACQPGPGLGPEGLLGGREASGPCRPRIWHTVRSRQQCSHALRRHRRRRPDAGRAGVTAASRAGTRSTWRPSRCWPWSSATTSTRPSSRTWSWAAP